MLIYSTKGSLGKENELVISQTGRGNTTSDKQFQKKKLKLHDFKCLQHSGICYVSTLYHYKRME